MSNTTKRRKKGAFGAYSNLAATRRTKKDAKARAKAEYLASLPKHPVKRVLYRMHPKRVLQYWFSKKGALMMLRILGVFILISMLAIGTVFAYFRKDLDALRPDQLAARVQTTVTRYYDRNGQLLWEDKGQGDYRLVVESDQISDYMKQATVAIEDKDFYKHDGVSINGIFRSLLNNAGGSGGIQGGSTLTQQLVKQVFLSEEALNSGRGLGGVPRKIKEVILAIEVERMYSKDQILNLYLNESPYGGRRNGVESAAKTYFDKDAKDLTLAESALLAAIPNSPSVYDPYSGDRQALVARQHAVLDNMADQGYITKQQADEAKAVPILDQIKPQVDQTADMKAPHFVLMVRQQLKQELGEAVVGRGGLNITTTLDLDIQNKLESATNDMFIGKYSYIPKNSGFTNSASIVEDVKTGQVLALLGSRDYNYPGFGQSNAATSFIQPGSSIKPFVYAQLLQDHGSTKQNYGAGSIMPDVPTTFQGNYTPLNADRKYDGPNETIRRAIGRSRNVPAVRAMVINEQNSPGSTWDTIHQMGDTSYCTDGVDAQAGLASAIGGCGVKMTEHVNAIASIARGGQYINQSYVLEVKNSTGEVLKKFTQPQAKQVVSDQSAYIVSDMLADQAVRASLFGSSITPIMNSKGSKMSLKTGTSDLNGNPKDLWNVAYTPHLAMAVWLGNPDPTTLRSGNSSLPTYIADPVMAYATEKYVNSGQAQYSDWFTQPAGIQHINGDIYPSYYNQKNSGITNDKLTFDRVSKKKATSCTPDAAKIEVDVTSYNDPVTKQKTYTYSGPDGYDTTKDDDVHNCSDVQPSVTISPSANGSNLTITYVQGTFALSTVTVSVNGSQIASFSVTGSGTRTVPNTAASSTSNTATAEVTDAGYYVGKGQASW